MKLTHRIFKKITPMVPMAVRSWVRANYSLQEYDLERNRKDNPYRDFKQKLFPESEFCLGIIEDKAQYHKHYIAACLDQKISFKILNLLANDWIHLFRESNCDAFLVWPSSTDTIWKNAFDYRLRFLEKELNKIIFPTWKECWLTEHKPRLRDWLDAKNLIHPETWVFYDKNRALDFAGKTSLPIVVKTATGASGTGVNIVKERNVLNKVVKKAFGKGLIPRGFNPWDRQRGYIYLQEYLPDVHEWRMVRIGDSFFGYRKEKGETGLHSASHKWSWLDPGEELLDLTRKVTDLGDFKSMNIDVFLTKDNRLLINECQTVFGCTTPVEQMKINNEEGRYRYLDNKWVFEKGVFCQNHMCNLRLKHLLDTLSQS